MKNPSGQEVEVKFYLTDPESLQQRLHDAGARLVGPRVLEINLRFDTPDGALTRQARVLRLRQDTTARMTYKGPADYLEEVASRREIEFEVSDFDSARALLEALGYTVAVSYEKYRTTYRWGNLEVVLDEMPYGIFAEIEGESGEAIRRAARQLGLNWSARVLESYLALFRKFKENRGLALQNLTFAEFEGLSVQPEDLGVKVAD